MTDKFGEESRHYPITKLIVTDTEPETKALQLACILIQKIKKLKKISIHFKSIVP